MEKLIIHKLGPIEHSELEVKDFMIFTGAQASGKSTIAKSIFFFKNIKNILLTLVRKKSFLKDSYFEERKIVSLKENVIKEIEYNFLQTFGSIKYMDKTMKLFFEYTKDTSIKIFLKEDENNFNVEVELSNALEHKINELENLVHLKKYGSSIAFFNLGEAEERVNEIFNSEDEVIYIPAGRSMITLLSSQLNYMYSSMDDIQKRNIDYCTQSYLENILKLKASFNSTLQEMIDKTLRRSIVEKNRVLIEQAMNFIKEILQGEYININGEERLQISKNHHIKINFASSGQQEVLWILNTLFYYLLLNKKACFIIEEPESNLFPKAQKSVVEFIALVKNAGNKVLLTTHSPYVLGTINNLLYADNISKKTDKEALDKIVSKNLWLNFSEFASYFLKNGTNEDCNDYELNGIQNEVIDEVSNILNEDFDKMLNLEQEREL